MCLYARFHQCIVIKPKAKKECLVATMLVFPILQKLPLQKILSRSVAMHILRTVNYVSRLCCSHVTSTHVWCGVVIGCCKKYDVKVASNVYNVHNKFCDNQSCGSKFERDLYT